VRPENRDELDAFAAQGAPAHAAGASDAADDVVDAEPEPTGPEAELAARTAERDRYLDQMRRIAAEFDNYKKRVAREQESLTRRAGERLILDLLPVLDDLERAVDAFEVHDKEHVAEGVALVHRALRGLLEREGLEEVAPDGEPFDPHRHEALLSQPSPEPEGTVIQVVQKGFVLGDRVLRPARVVVAAAQE
jgi:molecular chaperone GrpE